MKLKSIIIDGFDEVENKWFTVYEIDHFGYKKKILVERSSTYLTRAVLDTIGDFKKLLELAAKGVGLKEIVVLEDENRELEYTIHGSSDSISEEELIVRTDRVGKDYKVKQHYKLSSNSEVLLKYTGITEEDEQSLSELTGTIGESYKNLEPILLRSSKNGKEILKYFSEIVYIDTDELEKHDTLLKRTTWLDEKLSVDSGKSLEVLKKLIPGMGFGVESINDEGKAVCKGSSKAVAEFDLDDMGSGYRKLSYLLPAALLGGKKGKTVYIEDISSSLHPTLLNNIVKELIVDKIEFTGQIITEFLNMF